MLYQRILYASENTCTVNILDGYDPALRAVAVKPVISADEDGINVAFRHSTAGTFGFWVVCSTKQLVSAWRMYHLIHSVRQLIPSHDALRLSTLFDGQLDDYDVDRYAEGCAKALGFPVHELLSEIERLLHTWPKANELLTMWRRLSEEMKESSYQQVRMFVDVMGVKGSRQFDELRQDLMLTEQRIRTAQQQREREEQLVTNGLAPGDSLAQFLEDIGYDRIILRVDDEAIPEFYSNERYNYDREVMATFLPREKWNEGITSMQVRVDPGGPYVTSYQTARDAPMVVFPLDHVMAEVVSLRWDYVTDRFLLRVRQAGSDTPGLEYSIAGLRQQIGDDTGLDGPLPAGQRAKWVVPTPRQSLGDIVKAFFTTP